MPLDKIHFPLLFLRRSSEIITEKKQECLRPFMWSELFHLAPSNIPRLFQPAPNAKLSTKTLYDYEYEGE